MLRGIIENVQKDFSEYLNLFPKVAYIPLSKVQEIAENLENAVINIGSKSWYSPSEFAIIDLRRHIAGIEDTAIETVDCETCFVDTKDFSEHLELALKIATA